MVVEICHQGNGRTGLEVKPRGHHNQGYLRGAIHEAHQLRFKQGYQQEKEATRTGRTDQVNKLIMGQRHCLHGEALRAWEAVTSPVIGHFYLL